MGRDRFYYPVTYDRHFSVSAALDFPELAVIPPETFWDMLEAS